MGFTINQMYLREMNWLCKKTKVGEQHMSDNLNEQYKRTIEILNDLSFAFCNELGIKFFLQVLKERLISADG